jgi:hypothetical protein
MAKSTTAVSFYLPPGRIVMGDPHSVQENDQQGRKREHPTVFFGVAVPKTTPGINEVIGLINQVARNHYANNPGIMEQINQGLNAPNFAWKVDDGDSAKNKDREGCAGCWIFRFSTSIFPLKCGDSQDNPIDPTMIKCGYYIDVVGSVDANKLTDKNAGVYLNPNGVRLLGYGKEIASGPTVGQLFAGKAAALPVGASALPVAGSPMPGAPAPMTTTPAAPGAAPMPGVAPMAGMPGVPAPAAPPAPGFAGGVTPPPPAPAAPPPAPVTIADIQAQSAALAAQAGVQHYPGHRVRPDRTGYDPDPTPAPIATPPAPMTNGGAVAGASSVPTAQVYDPMMPGAAAPGVPAGAMPGVALGTPPNGSTTVSPSNPPAGVVPHPGFLTPPAAPQSPDDISAALAAQAGVQHHAGWRIRPDRTGYDPNPAVG